MIAASMEAMDLRSEARDTQQAMKNLGSILDALARGEGGESSRS